jgi:polyisoprenoid-binding protein YceI
MRLAILSLLVFAALAQPAQPQVPVFQTTAGDSTIKFYVKASVALTGNFDKWDATLKFTQSTPAVA